MWVEKWEDGRIVVRSWTDRVKAEGGKTAGERVVEKLKAKAAVVKNSVKISSMSTIGKGGQVEQMTIEVRFN